MAYTILVVEDDAAIRTALVDALEYAGHEPIHCADGCEALRLAREADPDLMLLDVMLPKMNGFQVLEELRKQRPTMPVIMVTARGAEEERVRGLENGADDYVVKPFSPRELLARVDAVLRRTPNGNGALRRLESELWRIDLDTHDVVWRDGESRKLTERESSILRYLFASRGRPVPRDELLRHVWNYNPEGLETRTVDMHIARLREKIESNPSCPRVIVTVRGKGYQMSEVVDAGSAKAGDS